MNRNRAWRLHQKAKYRNYTRNFLNANRLVEKVGESVIRGREKNRAVCSCYMCGNPRRGNKHSDLTLQEIRQNNRDRHNDAD